MNGECFLVVRSSDVGALCRRLGAFIMVAHCHLCCGPDTILPVFGSEDTFVAVVFASICLCFGLRGHNVLAGENLALDIVHLVALSGFQRSTVYAILIVGASFASNSFV